MKLALFALATMAAAFVAHVGLWRLRLPRRQTNALLAIFLGSLPAALLLARLVPPLRPYLPATAWDLLLLLSFHVPLSLAYIALYSAIETDSPSCLVVAAVAQAGRDGCGREELGLIVGSEQLGRRIEGLAGSGMAEERAGRLRLRPRGLLLARLFAAVDAVLGCAGGG